ncbi:hypothetical protein G9C98_001752 [Cotesia typhae]|uniref:Wntless-like transmembrane domain-containing protein n=1 Tax=Cotesia typhae TaxID=2053667 RepID=A0A8J5QTS2_9HYME|nr:hypothetical protein G9C98_001752 [Cotesia typhae]
MDNGLGYSYHLPSGGWSLKIRNTLTQFSDLFSEFNKYIAPAYHHDRCERSVPMRLYSMHKREFVMVFVAFFACFGLAVFIGLAGPPITSTLEEKAKSNSTDMASGPFIMKTPALSTYSQQLWVIAKFSTSNTDDERYDKRFQVSVKIDGVTEDDKLVPVLSSETAHRNRTRHLKCERQCWFGHSLKKYPMNDWSIEQKWVSVLLPLLILYNRMLDAITQTTFLCAILMFWLCVYHGLRQNDRRLLTFYLPKLLVVGSLWCSALTLATWLRWTELEDPTYDYALDTSNYYGFKVFFFTIGAIYIAYLLLLMLRAYSELRAMPYFDLRLRFLTLLAVIVATVSGIVTSRHFGAGVLEDSFASRLSTYYRTSAQFMALYGLLNFYLYTMAYVYSPGLQQVYGQHSSITKDNPTFSMINESDEDILYGSDEDSRRPLTRATRNTDDSD